jgi:choloylglycine hydrolase
MLKIMKFFFVVGLIISLSSISSSACTGIRLIAQDKSVVYGRSMEWGAFDLQSRINIIPRGYKFRGLTPDGLNGKSWKTKYGIVGLDMMYKKALADGINEKGLSGGLFYHPGFAEYEKYSKKNAKKTITALDILGYILGNYKDVDDIKKHFTKDVIVVGVVEELIGIKVDAHYMFTDKHGKSVIIEFTNGKTKFHDAPLGVITNAPNYDWHMINLRNYVNISQVAIPDKKIQNLDFKPLGAGSGMIGLPGDTTPPSRFIRAVAYSQTARKTPTSSETIYELFRILDNFNLGLGSAEGSEHAQKGKDALRSSTIWTTGYDLKNKILYYHTQHNRRLRMLDLKKIDFSNIGKKIIYIKLDEKKEQDIQDITPNISK